MRRILAVIFAAVIALATIAPAFASVPPGQRGHEGQPGNQGGYQHAGLQGYEGQPGNQGG
jgi:regulator of protease activity HflC (stomatin/prohibitin superfamily)